VSALVQGQRVSGGFILITGQDGIRYALRPNQVAVIHDADECHDETILRIFRIQRQHGSEVVTGRANLSPLPASTAPGQCVRRSTCGGSGRWATGGRPNSASRAHRLPSIPVRTDRPSRSRGGSSCPRRQGGAPPNDDPWSGSSDRYRIGGVGTASGRFQEGPRLRSLGRTHAVATLPAAASKSSVRP